MSMYACNEKTWMEDLLNCGLNDDLIKLFLNNYNETKNSQMSAIKKHNVFSDTYVIAYSYTMTACAFANRKEYMLYFSEIASKFNIEVDEFVSKLALLCDTAYEVLLKYKV